MDAAFLRQPQAPTPPLYYSTWAVKSVTPGKSSDPLTVIGNACLLAARSANHGRQPVSAIVSGLQAPLSLGQLHLFHNHFGRCLGYVTWASVSPRTERLLLSDPNYRLKGFEWNEGDRLWIVDLLVPDGGIREVLADMRDNVFARHRTVTYCRFKAGKRIVKQLSRDDRSAFFLPRD